MAILKKRTSSRQLPEARGLDRAPLDSVIRNFNDRPSLTGRTSGSLTSEGSGQRPNQRPSLTTGATTSGGATLPPVTSTVTSPTSKPTLPTKPPASLTTKTTAKPKTTLAPKVPLTTKPSLTSKTTLPKVTTPTVKPTVKPTVTNKTTTTPTTKTTPTSVVKKPTVTPTKTNPNSTANKVTNAVTGAVLGAGTKLIYDKITGKPVVKTPAGGTPKPPAGGTPKPPVGGTPKPPVGGTPKPPAGGTPKPPAGGTPKPPAGGTKPPITSTVLTDEEVQAELDRVKASEEAGAPPEGAIDNGDGTYSVTEDGMVTTYNADGTIAGMEAATDTTTADASTDTSGVTNDGVITRGLGSVTGDTTVAEGEGDTTVADTAYYQDDEGNYYTMNDDGGYDLAYYADGSEYTDTYTDGSGDTTVADNTYTDPDTGAEWTMADNGEWTTDFNYDDYYASDDYALADNTDNTDYTDYTVADNSDYDSYDYGDDGDYFGKRGGLITMMKKGGVPRFEEGGYSDTGEEVQDWQNTNYNYGEFDEPSLTGDDSLYSQSGPVNNTYLRSTPVAMASSSSDNSYVDNGDGTYTIGNFTYDMMTDEYMYSTDADTGQITNVSPDYSYSTNPVEDYYDTDSLGNVFKNGEFYRAAEVPEDITSISNVGSGGTNTKKDVYQTDAQGNVFKNGVFYRAAEIPEAPTGGLSSDFLNTITGALGTTAGAAGAGALIASLLGSDFSGGSGAQNQGVDMSQVGLINPRTTDFGIGPTNFVGYDQYGTDAEDYTPNEELLRNLNAPGYNPVNEGDYGYEDVASEDIAEEEVPAMASGGLSSMATPVASYYTFGQPADIMANLGMRPQPPMNPPEMMPQIGQQQSPQQTQQQGLPQQAPPQMAQQMPQGMPQQGMMPQQQGMAPPMRKGGLPHVSNVPLTQGRMDFRKGAAVHGEGDGQSDDIPAMLADGEYVIDAETVAQIGNGSTKAGAQALDKFREGIRAHKRSAPINKIPPKTKALTSYLKGAK